MGTQNPETEKGMGSNMPLVSSNDDHNDSSQHHCVLVTPDKDDNASLSVTVKASNVHKGVEPVRNISLSVLRASKYESSVRRRIALGGEYYEKCTLSHVYTSLYR